MTRRSKPGREWATGLGLVVLIAGLGLWLVGRSRAVGDIELELAEPLVFVDDGTRPLPSEWRVRPERVRERMGLYLDGVGRPIEVGEVAADGSFVVTSELPPLTPGFHLLELRPGYARRTAALGVVAGPFAEAGSWCERGLRIRLDQDLLNRFEQPVAALLARKVRERLRRRGEDGEVKSDLTLSWSDRGLDVDGEIGLDDGTRVVFRARLAVDVDRAGRLRLRRRGGIDAEVHGPLKRKGRLLSSVAAGAAGGAVLGPWGAVGGAVVGLLGGGKATDMKAEHDLNGALDARLEHLGKALLDFTSIPLDGGRARLELRPATIDLTPGESLELHLDVRFDGPLGEHPGALRTDAGAPPPATDADVSVSFGADALNEVLHGLWRIGLLDRLLSDPALTERLAAALEKTVYQLAGLELAAPPLLVGGPRGARLYLPATILELGRRDAAPRRARFALGAGLAAAVPADERAVLLTIDHPEAWSVCEEPRAGTWRVTPCLADVTAVARHELARRGDTEVRLASLPAEAFLPAAGELQIRLASARASLTDGPSGAALAIGIDVTVE